MRARAAAIAAALFFCHIVMTDGGKYHPPLLFLLFSFCSQYKSKKISPGVTFWILCTKMHVCTRFGSWRPPCIFQNLFIIIILMQMIISQTKDFAQTNGYLSNKRRAQSRRGVHPTPAPNTSLKHRNEGTSNGPGGRPMVAPTKVVRGSYSNERSSLKRTISLNPVGATIGRPLRGFISTFIPTLERCV